MKNTFAFIFAAIMSLATYGQTQEPYTEKTPMPSDRSALCTAIFDGKIYAIGGLKNESASLSVVEVYDPVTDSWISKTPMPTARCIMGCAIVDGKIYVIGGSTTGGPDVISIVEVYDPITDTWESKAPMPTARGDVSVEAVNGKIYAIGGSARTGTTWAGLNTVEEYDPAEDTWTSKSDMPTPRWSLGTCVIDGKIYAIGGNIKHPDIASVVEVYDPVTDSWDTSKSSMSTSRYSLSTCFLNGKIFAFGGWKLCSAGHPMYDLLEVYDVERDVWTPGADLPFKIAILSTETLNGKIYLIGGTNRQHTFRSIENVFEYDPTSEFTWEQMESMDMERGIPSSTVVDHMIYVFGGMDKNFATLSSARAYNSITNEWSELENMPKDLFGGPAAAINGKIYVVGGYSHSGGDWIPSNSTLEYDPDGDVWQTKSNSPEPKAGLSSCVLGDTLYILGGNSENEKEAWYYVPETDSWGILPDMIYERPASSSAVTIDNLIYVTGGTFESGLENPTGKSEVYDPQSQVWTELADMPVQIKNHISVVHDQKILVFGGDSTRTEGGTSIGTNFIQAYDPSTDSWKIMKGMPFKRAGMGGGKVDGFVYLIGGYLNSMQNPPLSEVWSFNLDSLKEWVVQCNEVLISQSSLTMTKGDTHSLSASVLPTYSSDRTVSWSSSDEAVATVSPEGEVTAVSGGETTITTTANGGGCTASCLVSITAVGISDTRADQIAIYPNPFEDLLTIQTSNKGSYQVEITSLNGKILYNGTIDRLESQIDLSKFAKGVYLITIRSKNFITTKKIIKL